MTDDWYYNLHTGQIRHITNALEKVWFDGVDFEVRFKSRADAQAYAAKHPPSHRSILDPTDPANPANIGQIPAVGPVTSAISSAVSTGQFLGALSNSNTWLRVAEVALGVVLVVVGLIKLAPPGVVQTVKTAGKAAAIL